MDPFLSIVTRCHPSERTRLLERCKQSVTAQSDIDLEHLFIRDAGRTLFEANRSFSRVKNKIRGKYVYILDDDDYLIDSDFVAATKVAAEKFDPDVIMVRGRFTAGKLAGTILPDKYSWERIPLGGHIGSPCFLVKRRLWSAHIKAFGVPSGGDISFILRLWNLGCEFLWLDRIVFEVDHIGRYER